MKRWYPLLVLLCIATAAYPIHPQELFLQAEKLYESGQYEQARDRYMQMSRKTSAAWYNLGNCFFELGVHPQAIASWKQAQKTAPRKLWHKCQGNIEQAYRALDLPTQQTGLGTYVAHQPYAVLYLQLLFLLCWYLLFGAKARLRNQKVRRTLCTILLLSSSVSGTWVVSNLYLDRKQSGIVLDTTPVLIGPCEQFDASGQLPAGASVTVHRLQDETWCKISYQNGHGWIKQEKLTLF